MLPLDHCYYNASKICQSDRRCATRQKAIGAHVKIDAQSLAPTSAALSLLGIAYDIYHYGTARSVCLLSALQLTQWHRSWAMVKQSESCRRFLKRASNSFTFADLFAMSRPTHVCTQSICLTNVIIIVAWVVEPTSRQRSFRGGTRGNAVPIVKLFKNALSNSLQFAICSCILCCILYFLNVYLHGEINVCMHFRTSAWCNRDFILGRVHSDETFNTLANCR